MADRARLAAGVFEELDGRLAPVDADLLARYPGDAGTRQPVHTVYVPGDRYTTGLVPGWGAQALATLARHAPDADALAAATGLEPALVAEVHPRVLAKLAAAALATSVEAGTAPPFVGIRFKSFEAATRHRGVRTLDLFLGGLLAAGPLPEGFVVTLPKVTAVEQVAAMSVLCDRLEAAYGLPAGRLRFEIQVETPQAILGADGAAPVARMVHAAAGRCTGLHFGTYDYSAALGVAAAYQSMEHPVADHAKAVMQLAAAGTGVRVSDGSTNVLPVGDADDVVHAWRLHARLVLRSLERAYYQGWDLHPAQLPTRFLATYVFFRSGLPAAAGRLRAYTQQVEGGVLDEPATAQALAGVIVRGLDCGAVDEAEARDLTGLDRAGLEGFARRRVG